MRKAHTHPSDLREPLNSVVDDENYLSAADWQRCIKDDCASWEMRCHVYINQDCHADIFPRPTLIRVQYSGASSSFDAQNWEGLVDTIEHEFEVAGFNTTAESQNSPNETASAWKQWVIVPHNLTRTVRFAR